MIMKTPAEGTGFMWEKIQTHSKEMDKDGISQNTVLLENENLLHLNTIAHLSFEHSD
jgi:hypothetical protein